MPRTHDRVALERARRARSNPSVAEDIMWEFLRAKRTGFKWRREHQITDDYRVDFYCQEAMLIVEMDGEQHDPKRDAERDADLAKLGFLTYRISNRIWFALDKEPYKDYIAEIVRLCEERAGRRAFPDPLP
ncbi:MAG TPA: DUF559 domain-containing protein [Fimbriimonas sp.]|nr:DUF559 domain-containing protein [Fimbriimonas sp.]